MLNHLVKVPLALIENELREICRTLADPELTKAHMALAIAMDRERKPRARTGATALIPILGPMSQRPSVFTAFFGGTVTELLRSQIEQAAADHSVDRIVLDVDSGGGTVAGTPELAQTIYDARKKKPIIAVANSVMASAAYWGSSQATKIVATPSAMVGSIGIFGLHTDISEAEKKAGIKTTLIGIPKYKTEGSEFEPLSDEAKQYVTRQLGQLYERFVADVACGRGVSNAKVRSKDYGEGRILTAQDALSAGMIDQIGTLDDVLNGRLDESKPRTAAYASATKPTPPVATSQTPPPVKRTLAPKPSDWPKLLKADEERKQKKQYFTRELASKREDLRVSLKYQSSHQIAYNAVALASLDLQIQPPQIFAHEYDEHRAGWAHRDQNRVDIALSQSKLDIPKTSAHECRHRWQMAHGFNLSREEEEKDARAYEKEFAALFLP